ncbi:MAG: hypothetical protein Q9174_004667 [Haloplaca sp. 1 TL-2023]
MYTTTPNFQTPLYRSSLLEFLYQTPQGPTDPLLASFRSATFLGIEGGKPHRPLSFNSYFAHHEFRIQPSPKLPLPFPIPRSREIRPRHAFRKRAALSGEIHGIRFRERTRWDVQH